MKKLIAVYGSLRKNMGNDHYLRNSKYLGEFKTEPIFSLYSLGGFPGLKENGSTSVVVEVYEVDEETAQNVDALEGYKEGRKATFYDKTYIDTPWGKAGIYIYVNPISEDRFVESGDWKDYKNKLYYSPTLN